MVMLLEDSLNEEAYLADVAGLYCGFVTEGRLGLDIRVCGESRDVAVGTTCHLLSLSSI